MVSAKAVASTARVLILCHKLSAETIDRCQLSEAHNCCMLTVGFFKVLRGLGKRHAHEAASQVPTHLHNALHMLQHAPVDLIQVRGACLSWYYESYATHRHEIKNFNKCCLRQVPGAGRGLAAAQPLLQGTAVHTEKPMLCHPSTKHIGKVSTQGFSPVCTTSCCIRCPLSAVVYRYSFASHMNSLTAQQQ